MRIPVILTCLLAVVLAAMPVRQAKADGVSFDVFYNNLSDDGDWYNTTDYGYVWHPTVADKSEKWRPYTDGYWAQTDDGWTWVSYENFGWATYHYGRWTRLKDIGWSWVPGYDWGPGWVSWRTSEDHVGWAPLPPRVEQGYEEGRPVEHHRDASVAIDYNTVEPADYGPDVDVQYDIGPENYCFVETRRFGAPVLAEVIEPPQRNVVIIEQTVNVTNIYRPPGGPVGPGGGFVVFNRGPDYNVINARCERPIQVLRIERHEDVMYLNNGIHGGGNANQVRGGVFAVAAPPIARGPINFAQVKPVRVKQTIERTEVVHGWSNSGADPATVQRLRDHFKQQAQQAPPPPREANPPRPEQLLRAKAEANQPPAPADNPPPPANANNKPPLTPEEKAARREARQKANTANASATPAPGQQAPVSAPDRGQKPNRGPATPAPGAPANPPGVNGQPLTPEEKAARKAQRQQAKTQQPPAAEQPPQPANNPPAPNPDKEARKAQRQQQQAQPNQQPAAQPPTPNPDKEARKAQRQQEKAQQAQPQPQPQAQPPAPNPEKEARKAQRQQEQQQAQPSQAQPPAPNPEKEARKAQRQQEQQQAQSPRAPQGNTPQPKSDDDKKKKKDQPDQ